MTMSVFSRAIDHNAWIAAGESPGVSGHGYGLSSLTDQFEAKRAEIKLLRARRSRLPHAA